MSKSVKNIPTNEAIKPHQDISVYIIESPSANDLYDQRSEAEILSKALKMARIKNKVFIVSSENKFIDALVDITLDIIDDRKQGDLKPIALHISMHGNREGLQLTNGQVLDWQYLKTLLSLVNNKIKDRMLICLSSCRGFNGVSMAFDEIAPPFFALVGSSEDIPWEDALIGYQTLYHLIKKGNGVMESVTAMKKASGNKSFKIMEGKHAQKIYLDAYKKLIRPKDLKEELAKAK